MISPHHFHPTNRVRPSNSNRVRPSNSNSLGRPIAHTDGRGNTSRTEYNAIGQRTASIDALGNRTAYAYDQFANLASVINPLGNAIVYEYDLRGRKTYEGGATYPVRYTYDVFGNKTTMMTYRDESRGPDSGDVTTWLYDEASGVMTNKVYADGKGPRYDYDSNGRLAKRTWARGIDTFYAYDGWGNLTNTTYSDDTPTVAIKYDALGRQIEAHDAAGVTTIAYDAFGANTNETVVGVAGTNVLERFTDEFGREAGYALNGERRTVIGRDPATGRIETMRAAGCTNAFRWSYHSGCDLKQTLLYPNGALVTWEYEPHRDLMTLVSNDVYSTFRYTYDAAGKRISKNDERYIYNVRGELILSTNIATGAEFAYRYDDIGNRLWSREFGTNCTYVANELNQYTNIVRGGVFELSAFDLDGNQTNVVTSTGVWSVTYNGENRPVRWHRAADDTAIRMAYDRMGRRTRIDNEICSYSEYQNIGNVLWGPVDSTAKQVALQLRTDADNTFVFHDASKNAVSLIRGGCTTRNVVYTPFNMYSGSEDGGLLPLLSSEFQDHELGLTYYNYRHYTGVYGRWLSRDPLLEAGFQNFVIANGYSIISLYASLPDYQKHEYLYLLNNGFSHIDYLGLCPTECNSATYNLSASVDLSSGKFGKLIKEVLGASLSFSYNHTEEIETCGKCCADGRCGTFTTTSISEGFSGDVSVPVWTFFEASISYSVSGSYEDTFDSCTYVRTHTGCGTTSVSASIGPCAKIGGDFGKACLKGQAEIKHKQCADGQDEWSGGGSIYIEGCIGWFCGSRTLWEW